MMSRPLNKFKAKRRDNGEWVSGVPMRVFPDDILYIVDEEDHAFRFIPSSLSPYTGRNDKTDREIYEGDILMLSGIKCVVVWNNTICAYCIRFSFEKRVGTKPLGSWLEECRECEVIGNIIDNPELIKIE